MCKMYLCPVCKAEFSLPTCIKCGFTVKSINNIMQISDSPDIVTDGDGDKYIGYEHIGEHFSGKRKHDIDERGRLCAEEIAKLTGDGIFLDIACGDGYFTVPCAAFGTKIIAGDISNAMLGILQDKAGLNGISLENVTLCRINALDIPLATESVDAAAANSVLHLISNPQKVISEIHRVLKKGGAFICIDDAPGNYDSQNSIDNSRYNEIVNGIYSKYWEELGKAGICPKKYSWHFDRNAYCQSIFESCEVKTVKRGNVFSIPMKDGFLPRITNRGFSDQVDVPADIHNRVLQNLLRDFKVIYGEDFEEIAYKGIEEDLIITIFRK